MNNPVETKPVDVLAAAAGVPTPAQARSLWGTAWRYRKLALVLGGAGIIGIGGGFGYKYFTANPGKANAQADPPAMAAAPKALPDQYPDDPWSNLPPVTPVKAETAGPEVPPIPDIAPPADIKMPIIKSPATTSETELPPLVLPPGPVGDTKLMDGPKLSGTTGTSAGFVTPPSVPEIKLPANDKKKPPPESADPFRAPADTKLGPTMLPVDVTERKEKPKTGGPVVAVDGVEPPPIPAPPPPATKKDDVPAVPAIPTIDVKTPAVAAPDPAKKGEPAIPMIPMIDIDLLPAPPKKEPVIPALPPIKDDPIPTITAPAIVIPGPRKDVPPVILVPMPKETIPEVKSPTIPSIPIPDLGPPTIDVNPGPPPVPAPAKKDSYDELWHDDKGDTYVMVSQEYFHDKKFAAALEAYNKDRRKPGDKIVRVPPIWVLEEQFGNLIGKSDQPDKPDRIAPVEVKPAGNSGIKFEPVAPLSSGSRPAPAAVSSKASDEYRVTAEAGETIREVARKVLGDSNAWRKLGNLNPDIDPTLPIPAGTTLRLPK